MQDEVLLRAWNAHREYINAIRGAGEGSAPGHRGRGHRWLDALLGTRSRHRTLDARR